MDKKKILWCPLCHTRIIPPEWVYDGKIAGNVKINCGNNNSKCKGFIKLKLKAKELSKEEMIKDIEEQYPKLDQIENPIFRKFGYFYTGVGDTWYWFNDLERFKPRDGHKFLQEATVEELKELIEELKINGCRTEK